MKILQLDTKPAVTFPYHHAGTLRDPWGNPGVMRYDMPVFWGETDYLPDGLDALLLTSDLQGLVTEPGGARLVGEVLPEFLAFYLNLEHPGIRPGKTGVVLAGDFFARLDQRGGLGDVRPVWRAFRQHFRWVAGVGGNHDDFGENLDALATFRREPGMFYFENEEKTLDGLRIGGISGVIAANEKHKHLRLSEAAFAEAVNRRLGSRPDIVLLHQNPYHAESPHKGGRVISEALGRAPGQLLVCGHAIWREALVELPNGAQVLNTGERVVLLKRRL
jgi:hypothetical protein